MPTQEPTAQPTPTVGPTTDTGLPTSILGLPVHTVAGMHELAASGALDGRMAAVAGFWTQEALPCAFMRHSPAVLGFCNGGRFADTAAELQTGSGGTAPIIVPETVGGSLLWQQAGPTAGAAARVALILHAADSRSWQCAMPDRRTCASNLIIDRVAWANGAELGIDQPDPNTAPANLHLRLDQVITAAAGPGDTVVLAYPIDAGSLNDVDPRFVGEGQGNVWYVRLISGPPDADGIAPGKDVLIDDATGAVVTTMPLSVDPSYGPARVTIDTDGQVPGPLGQARFWVSAEGAVVAHGRLDSSLAPLALEPGDYTVLALGDTGAIMASPKLPQCSLDLSVAAGDNVAFYADWPGGADCTWKEGEWPFN